MGVDGVYITTLVPTSKWSYLTPKSFAYIGQPAYPTAGTSHKHTHTQTQAHSFHSLVAWPRRALFQAWPFPAPLKPFPRLSSLEVGSCPGFFPFRTQPPIVLPSSLPQLTSSVALTPRDTRHRRRRRIYSCSLCTRGSLNGRDWVQLAAGVVSVGGRRAWRSGRGVSI